jgi:hypothetical protein
VNLRTLAVILAAGLWMPSHFHYGWLLLQTVTSAPNLWIAVVFAIQFTLCLFPIVGLFALMTVEKLKARLNKL